MKTLILVGLLLNAFGWPLYWGWAGYRVFAPVIWAIVVTAVAILTGWRQGGIMRSVAIGMIFSLEAFGLLYYAGRLLSRHS